VRLIDPDGASPEEPVYKMNANGEIIAIWPEWGDAASLVIGAEAEMVELAARQTAKGLANLRCNVQANTAGAKLMKGVATKANLFGSAVGIISNAFSAADNFFMVRMFVVQLTRFRWDAMPEL